MLSTACVDKDYDLGNIDTDNIAIGDEGSQFRIPLVKVLVSKDEIKNNGGNIEEIFREADIWFPSQLPDGKFVDLVKLQDKDDQTYVNTLLRTLREEMQASDAKLASVVDLVWDKYAAEFLLLLNLTAPDEQTFKTAFKTAYRNDASLRERLADEVSALARTYLTGSLGIDQLEYEVGHIDISSDIVDMLADNLDPEGTPNARNTLFLYGQIQRTAPFAAPRSEFFAHGDHVPGRSRRRQGIERHSPNAAFRRRPAADRRGHHDPDSRDAHGILSRQRIQRRPVPDRHQPEPAQERRTETRHLNRTPS